MWKSWIFFHGFKVYFRKALSWVREGPCSCRFRKFWVVAVRRYDRNRTQVAFCVVLHIIVSLRKKNNLFHNEKCYRHCQNVFLLRKCTLLSTILIIHLSEMEIHYTFRYFKLFLQHVWSLRSTHFSFRFTLLLTHRLGSFGNNISLPNVNP